MIDRQHGLEEAFAVFEAFPPSERDFDKGILQAIGYKEFYPVYDHLDDLTTCKQRLL